MFLSSQKQYHFMGGLPRSGSTLLSSILNQNPRFDSGTSSPVLAMMHTIIDHLWNDELYQAYPKPNQATQIVSNIINQWYSDVTAPVIFDKNRAWTARIDLIKGYLGIDNPKILCPVRDTDEILTSFISMIRRNPFKEGQTRINFIDEQLVKANIPLTDENRCVYMMEGSGGIIGESYNAIFEGLNQGYGDCFYFIDYNDLIDDPQQTMNGIYEFLGEEPYDHDYNRLFNKHQEDDLNTYGLQDMHTVRTSLEKTSADPKDVLPESILGKYKDREFWKPRQPNLIV